MAPGRRQGRRYLSNRAEPPASTTETDAVDHASGPARIIAPAGSGKTRVLTARLRHLLRDRGWEPGLITAVAYNTRAAAEMRERTADLSPTIRTLHAFAWRIVNDVEQRNLIDEPQVREIMGKFITVAKIPNQDPMGPYIEALADVRLGLQDPQTVEVERGDVDGFADAFEPFRTELARRGAIDFDEQVYRAIELLLTRPDVRRIAQQRATHLLVDEFQDLTPAFLLMVRLVSAPFLEVFGVGDDDQTIYGHTGADPEFLIDFDRFFPGAAAHPLQVNHRCPPVVVTAADNLLRHNTRRVDKVIESGRVDDTTVAENIVRHLVPVGAMAERTVRTIREHLDAGASPADIAVLTRVNASLLPVQIALAAAGIPREAPIDQRVLQRTGLRTCLAYLRIATNPERISRRDLEETVRRPARKLTTALRDTLPRRSHFDMDALIAQSSMFSGAARDRYDEYLDDLTGLIAAADGGADVARLVFIIRDRIGLGEAMASLDSGRTKPQGSSHTDDLDALDQLSPLHPEPSTFGTWLRESLQHGADEGGVTLSSVHRVKGMEWDHVVVTAATDGLFPHRLAEGRFEVEEERRVFHVAMTRSRQTLDIIADKSAPTPFLAELGAPPRPRAARATKPAATTPPVANSIGVHARVGLEVGLPFGATGVVRAADTHDVTLEVSGLGPLPAVTILLGSGTPVVIDGEANRLLTAAPKPRTTPAATLLGDVRAAADTELSPEDDAVFQSLRTWRGERARADKLPAYVILHDAALRAIARSRPDSVRRLATIPGIGPTKLDRYADELLELVAASG